jgi:hypothetical protein
MTMADTNLFKDLNDTLKEFDDFLDSDTVAKVAKVISALAALVPKINELVDKLIKLLGDLKTAIQKLDVKNIEGLEKAAEFTGKIKNLLTATKDLLPTLLPAKDASDIDSEITEVLKLTDVVSSLPSLDDVKKEITDRIDKITAKLQTFKS